MSEARKRIREIAAAHRARGDDRGWFEAVYRTANGDRSFVAWADGVPNPHVIAWIDGEAGVLEDESKPPRASTEPAGGTPARPGASGAAAREVLEVGCGLGDTSEALAARGFAVTAFDISPRAVRWCRERFPGSDVNYVTADLLAPPAAWRERFPLIVECYTLQVMPSEMRGHAMRALERMLAPGGRILVIARARDENEPAGELPWPLTESELRAFAFEANRAPGSDASPQDGGLALVSVERFVDNEEPPTSRFRAVYRKRGGAAGEGCA